MEFNMKQTFRFAERLGLANIIHVHKPSINLQEILVVNKVAMMRNLDVLCNTVDDICKTHEVITKQVKLI